MSYFFLINVNLPSYISTDTFCYRSSLFRLWMLVKLACEDLDEPSDNKLYLYYRRKVGGREALFS